MKTLRHILDALLLALTLLAPLRATSQNHLYNPDSAEVIVGNYLRVLNYDGLPTDSILYMETRIVNSSMPNDTAIMRRWFLNPNKHRFELWYGDTLMEGLFTNGKDVFYMTSTRERLPWLPVTPDKFYDNLVENDFRGTLYNWRAYGSELTYEGVWQFNGHQVYRILVETPYKYNRYYLFEKETGLLFLIQETNTFSEYTNHAEYEHPDWHAIHEFMPVGQSVIPSVESYQFRDAHVVHHTAFRFLPVDMNVFTKP